MKFLQHLLLILLFSATRVTAQQLSYVYIQGDKQTPFYVKLDGTMAERYGKNYSILSQLAPGPATLQILFQQNAFPAQTFKIQIPEGGSRGFLLLQKNGSFSLYDVQQQFYLAAGNTLEDDHLPVISPAPAAAFAVETDTLDEEDDTPQQIITKAIPPVKEQKTAQVKAGKTKVVKEKKPLFLPLTKEKKEETEAPQFINNIELRNDLDQAVIRPTGKEATTPPNDTFQATVTRQPLAGTFRNSDCPAALDNEKFERVYKEMMQKATDEDRTDYLNNQMDKCYLTWQARTLGAMLTEDAARYTFLKKVYPRITDQQEFPLLDDLLRSEVWKAQFQQLIHH